MNLHMRIQSAFDREAFAAVIAFIRSFARMRANMPDEIAWFTESFRTVLAFISIFLGLFLHVFLNDQITLSLITNHFADARLCELMQIFICTYIGAVHAFSLGDCVHQNFFGN